MISATGSPSVRAAEIHKQLSAICPKPLSQDDLTAAADLVDAYPKAAPVIARELRMHKETVICRGV